MLVYQITLTEDLLQQRPYNQGYLPNGAAQGHIPPGAAPLLPNNGRIIQTGGVRVLCVADVRGAFARKKLASSEN